VENQIQEEKSTIDGLSGEKITDTARLIYFESVPLWTLGFFKALVDHLNLKSAENPTVPWMELLADSHTFEYYPISVFDIMAMITSKIFACFSMNLSTMSTQFSFAVHCLSQVLHEAQS
jgi:hypothetical protein